MTSEKIKIRRDSNAEDIRFLWCLIVDFWEIADCRNLREGKFSLPINSNGHIDVEGGAYCPDQMLTQLEIERFIDRHNYYEGMCQEAKAIISFVTKGNAKELNRLCGSPKNALINEERVSAYFRRKWGRRRVAKAVSQIKKLLLI